MQVQVSSDSKIQGGESLADWARTETLDKLRRFGEQITRVDVYLSDAGASHGGTPDRRCTLEARPAGRPPLAVSHDAVKLADAVHGALDKLTRKLDTTLGRQRDAHGRESIRSAGSDSE